MIFCLFVYCFSSLFEIFSFIRRDQQNHRRAAELDLCSALMAIKHWNFFGVPHLLWHGISVFKVIFEELVPFTTFVERLSIMHCLFWCFRTFETGSTPCSCKTNDKATCATVVAYLCNEKHTCTHFYRYSSFAFLKRMQKFNFNQVILEKGL